MAELDLYARLGLKSDATAAEIDAAYEQILATDSPDQLTADARNEIETAYEELRDPIRRLRYDVRLVTSPPPRFRFQLRLPHAALPRWVPRPHLHPDRRALIAAGVLAGVAGIFVLLAVFGRSRPPQGEPAQALVAPADSQIEAPSPTPIAASSPGALGIPGVFGGLNLPSLGSLASAGGGPTLGPLPPITSLASSPSSASVAPSSPAAPSAPVTAVRAPLASAQPGSPAQQAETELAAPSEASTSQSATNRIFVPSAAITDGGRGNAAGPNHILVPLMRAR